MITTLAILQQVLDVQGLLARMRREDGQDMIEYALLAALVSIVAIVLIIAIGPYLDNIFDDIITSLNSA